MAVTETVKQMKNVLEAEGLIKRFGDKTAIDEIGRASCRERV